MTAAVVGKRRCRRGWMAFVLVSSCSISFSSAKSSTAFNFPFTSTPSVSSDYDATFTVLTQTAVGLVSYASLVVHFDRPRGEILLDEPLDDTLVVKSSQVEGAGMGLYAKNFMKEGTILGTYPGVVRPLDRYRFGKLLSQPRSGEYIWRFSDNKMIIDPTDREGNLNDYCVGGSTDFPLSEFLMETLLSWCLPVPTLFARINEPPPGGDCNVFAEENLDRRKVTFTLERDVSPGEELFLDYGRTYDRSGYTRADG